MGHILRMSLLLALAAAAGFSADVTGQWKGQFGGADQARELTFDFSMKGAALAGTVKGLADRPLEIKDGKVEGDMVTFWVQSEYQGQAVKLMYKGQISGGAIKFTISNEEGSWSTDLFARKSS